MPDTSDTTGSVAEELGSLLKLLRNRIYRGFFFFFSSRKSSLFQHPKQAQIVGVSGSSSDGSEQGSHEREGQWDVTLCTAEFYHHQKTK